MADSRPRAVIIGGGPAGLTAAYELLRRTDVLPLVLEKDSILGGLARTVNYKGNRIDIGGHRFFSKSDRVMDWWLQFLPIQSTGSADEEVYYHGQHRTVHPSEAAPATEDRIMLVRKRRSRIYFLRKFFDYPISLSIRTVANLGVWRMAKVGVSFLKASVFPIRPERTLDQFFTNRFGAELYKTFFQSYTEKVWGVPCSQISAEWGAQRVKGLSLWKAAGHFLQNLIPKPKDIRQKHLETSLIEKFLYPKLGPGQMWETVAERITEMGGSIVMQAEVLGIVTDGKRIRSIKYRDAESGQIQTIEADFFMSTMPVKELVAALDCNVDAEIRRIANGLVYRDFITVGLLVDKLKIRDPEAPQRKFVSDNWIYIQEPDVMLGRLQIFNNWSPALVSDPDKVWLGLEYFCDEKDEIWGWNSEQMQKFAAAELEKIGIINGADVCDSTVLKMPKTYPGYFGTYGEFGTLREFLDGFENLFLIGRNGMHKYNNQDHSMLTAMTAVDNIAAGSCSKDNIWSINTELDYHEEKATEK